MRQGSWRRGQVRATWRLSPDRDPSGYAYPLRHPIGAPLSPPINGQSRTKRLSREGMMPGDDAAGEMKQTEVVGGLLAPADQDGAAAVQPGVGPAPPPRSCPWPGDNA